ncbi:hypothetical protein MNKW57_27850 [Biformimicrobium ophioploci]|uniref:Uncharacterized protein n=1 Tax=Biformimicrobium ophioploci TaxID=3036711 RepID=A0ABQ6M283_9GAMM|nr:hypothetical protein MNKW57_27850 [Microbulbifer sp. NKW57]
MTKKAQKSPRLRKTDGKFAGLRARNITRAVAAAGLSLHLQGKMVSPDEKIQFLCRSGCLT